MKEEKKVLSTLVHAQTEEPTTTKVEGFCGANYSSGGTSCGRNYKSPDGTSGTSEDLDILI